MESPQVDTQTRLDHLRQHRNPRLSSRRVLIAIAAVSAFGFACATLGPDFIMLTILVLMCLIGLVAPWLFLLSDPYRARIGKRFSLASLFIVMTVTGVGSLAARIFSTEVMIAGIFVPLAVLTFVLLTFGIFGTFQTSLRRQRVVEETPVWSPSQARNNPDERRPNRKQRRKTGLGQPWNKFDQ